MIEAGGQTGSHDITASLAAIHRSQAVVEFAPDGTILTANDRFMALMGYRLDELVGRHHRMFVADDVADSPGYAAFWATLARGDYVVAEFKRLRKDGQEVWSQGSYNPVLDDDGKPVRIIKYSTDITAAKIKSADDAGQIAAIGNTQAVITFTLDGIIASANPRFCNAVRYGADELVGRHHSLLVTPGHEASADYRHFWDSLRKGRSMAGEFCRIRKDGRNVWLQATYTPILDPDGRPFKIVKYASDITTQIEQRANAANTMQTMLDSMTSVVGQLDKVASTTRLLSINATIEAAHAADAGRGFAVVASEVRSLAGQAAAAAGAIRKLVVDSKAQVQRLTD